MILICHDCNENSWTQSVLVVPVKLDQADKETCAGALERTSLTSASAPHTTMHSFSPASPNSKRAEAAAAAAEGANLVGRNVDPESVGIEAGCRTVVRSFALLIAYRFGSVSRAGRGSKGTT